MAKIVVDTDRWPLVVVRYPRAFSDEEWSAHGRELHALFERRAPFLLLSDASRIASPPNAKQRRYAAQQIAARRDDWRRHCLGVAFCRPHGWFAAS